MLIFERKLNFFQIIIIARFLIEIYWIKIQSRRIVSSQINRKPIKKYRRSAIHKYSTIWFVFNFCYIFGLLTFFLTLLQIVANSFESEIGFFQTNSINFLKMLPYFHKLFSLFYFTLYKVLLKPSKIFLQSLWKFINYLTKIDLLLSKFD